MSLAGVCLYSYTFASNVSNVKAGKSIFPAAVSFWSPLAGLSANSVHQTKISAYSTRKREQLFYISIIQISVSHRFRQMYFRLNQRKG